MDSNTYYTDLYKSFAEVENQIMQISSLADDVYSTQVNYSELLKVLNDRKRILKRLLAAHKLAKMSKEQYLSTLTNKTTQTTYTVKQYDTPLSIAQQFNLTVVELLQMNGITTKDITVGKILIVPYTELTEEIEMADIPTFGDQTGVLVLGQDVTVDLKETLTGDLEILSPEKTFSQGIHSRLKTQAGQYPGEDDFGLSELVGTDLDNDTLKNMFMVKVINQLALDPRVKSIDNLDVTRQGNAITLTGKVYSIANTQVILNGS